MILSLRATVYVRITGAHTYKMSLDNYEANQRIIKVPTDARWADGVHISRLFDDRCSSE